MTRGELARRTGCHAETVRYYEQIRLLRHPPRSPSGYRDYAAVDERRLRFILRGRELGFSIDELRELLSLVDREAVTCGQAERAAQRYLAIVRQKIADLRRMERTLSATAASCGGRKAPNFLLLEALWR